MNRRNKFVQFSESLELTDPRTIELTEDGACFLHVDKVSDSVRRLAVAFYDSGVVQFFHDNDEKGILSESKHKFVDFSNHVPNRQEKSHIHCVRPASADGDYFVVDLGADRIYIVKFNHKTFL